MSNSRPGHWRYAVLLLGVFTSSLAYPSDVATCDAWPDGFSVSPGLSLHSCVVVDPLTVDLRKVKQEMLACDLPDGTHVEHALSGADMVNHAIRLTRSGETLVQFTVEPKSAVRTEGIGAATALSCDQEGRFYYVHTYRGYVVAFDRSGQELWRRDLPGFVGLDSRVANQTLNMTQVFEAFRDWASKGQQSRTSGEYVVVEYKTRADATWHIVFHRSGALIGRIGPWDGILTGSTEKGWKLVAGGGSDIRFYVPKVQLELEVQDRTAESLINHGIAWVMPRPTDRHLEMSCLARLDNELEFWMRDRYVAEHARQSKDMVLQLGATWYSDLLARPPVVDAVRTFNPPSSEWQEAFRTSLIESGADVDLAGTREDFGISRTGGGRTKDALPSTSGSSAVSSPPKTENRGLRLEDLSSASVPVTLNYQNASLGGVFHLIAAATGLGVTVDEAIKADTVSVSYDKILLREALEKMARDLGLSYRIESPDSIVVSRTTASQ